jgi:hypothetical protein
METKRTTQIMKPKVGALKSSWKNAKKIWLEHARHLGYYEKTKPPHHSYRRKRKDTS